jgi:hypothetical protein
MAAAALCRILILHRQLLIVSALAALPCPARSVWAGGTPLEIRGRLLQCSSARAASSGRIIYI